MGFDPGEMMRRLEKGHRFQMDGEGLKQATGMGPELET